jgi:glycine cleavage system transcriptional repressor
MLTLVGEDRPGIVAGVTGALYAHGWSLGETSMMRLGGNFTIMMMVAHVKPAVPLEDVLRPVADEMGLAVHVDPISGGLHQHVVPNIQVRVIGADRAGIVAEVTGALAEAGFNILELESDVAGDEGSPVYIMNIEGCATVPVENLQQAVDALDIPDMDVKVSAIETYVG